MNSFKNLQTFWLKLSNNSSSEAPERVEQVARVKKDKIEYFSQVFCPLIRFLLRTFLTHESLFHGISL